MLLSVTKYCKRDFGKAREITVGNLVKIAGKQIIIFDFFFGFLLTNPL